MKREPAVQVIAGQNVIITAANMFDDEVFDVRYVLDNDKCSIDDAEDVPYSPDGTPVFLSPARNPIILSIPGYYRLVPRGVVNDNARIFHKAVPACKGC